MAEPRLLDRVRALQELLGHADVKTAMISAHVLGLGASGVRSPLDALNGDIAAKKDWP